MHRILPLVLAAALLLGGCASAPPESPTAASTPPQTESAPPETQPDVRPAELHSPLYIEDLRTEDVILFFEEVCLDAEISRSGDPGRLQKWDSPIRYQIRGEPTAEDLLMLESFFLWMADVPGFPGFTGIPEGETPDMDIYFCTQDQMAQTLGDWSLSCDGGVTFWYDQDRIHTAQICIRTDLDQTLRNAVILEELYNSLGPIQDTQLRQDSVIYSGFTQPQWLSPIDRLILQLLYHPDLKPGMTAVECTQIIRTLYY